MARRSSHKGRANPSNKAHRRFDEQLDGNNNTSDAKSESSEQDATATVQPNMAYSDQRLTTQHDDQKLQNIISTIEADDTMCLKMRWYVARHVRNNFDATKAASRQKFTKKVREEHNWEDAVAPSGLTYQKLVQYNTKHLNRLDFEAERAQCGFRKDQPGWQYSRIAQILQRAYEEHNWNPIVTEADVDDVLEAAGADLTLFQNVAGVEAADAEAEADGDADASFSSVIIPRPSQSLAPSGQKQNNPSKSNASNATKQMGKRVSPRVTTGDGSPALETDEDIEALRSEVREEIEALHSEVLQLKETVDAAMQSMTSLNTTQDGFKNSQDTVLSEIKKLRRAMDGKDIKNQEGKGAKREKRKRRDKESKKAKKIRKLMKTVAKELEGYSSNESSSSSES